jgi:site-specific recombinase XerD
MYEFHLKAYHKTMAERISPTEYLENKRAAGWKPTTLLGACRVLSVFFRYLEAQEIILKAPSIPSPRIPNIFPPSFNPGTLEATLKTIDRKTDFGCRDYALILFYADSGVRLSEALSLELPKLNLQTDSAQIFGKGGKDRIVGFGQTTRKALLSWLSRRPDSPTGYVFINRWGKRLADVTVEQKIKKLTRIAGVDSYRLNAHALRHFHALESLNAGADPKSVQRQLGHTTLAMTLKYVNRLEADAVRVSQRSSPIDRLRGGAVLR